MARQVFLDGRQVEEVGDEDFAQLRVRHAARLAVDDENALHQRILQAFQQHALADHAGGAGDDGLDRHEMPMPRAISVAQATMPKNSASWARSSIMILRYSSSPTTGAWPAFVDLPHLMKRMVG